MLQKVQNLLNTIRILDRMDASDSQLFFELFDVMVADPEVKTMVCKDYTDVLDAWFDHMEEILDSSFDICETLLELYQTLKSSKSNKYLFLNAPLSSTVIVPFKDNFLRLGCYQHSPEDPDFTLTLFGGAFAWYNPTTETPLSLVNELRESSHQDVADIPRFLFDEFFGDHFSRKNHL